MSVIESAQLVVGCSSSVWMDIVQQHRSLFAMRNVGGVQLTVTRVAVFAEGEVCFDWSVVSSPPAGEPSRVGNVPPGNRTNVCIKDGERNTYIHVSGAGGGTCTILFTRVARRVQMPLVNDNVYEPISELFSIQLSNVRGGAFLGLNSSVVVTVLDDGDVSVPDAPPAPTFWAHSGGTLTIAISPPTNKGAFNAVISSYTAEVASSPGGQFDPIWTGPSVKPVLYFSGSGAQLSPLTAQSTYYVRVRATTAAGTSAPSAVLACSTGVATVPGPPTLSASDITGGSAVLVWTPNKDLGGATVSSYTLCALSPGTLVELQCNDVSTAGGPPGPGQSYSNAFAQTSFSWMQLSSAMTLKFAVRASNSVGDGNSSNLVVVQTAAPNVASVVQSVAVDAQATTGGSLTVQFFPPVDSGGVMQSALVYRAIARRGVNGPVVSVATDQFSARKAASFPGATDDIPSDGTETLSLILDKLAPKTSYSVSIQVRNSARARCSY